MFWQSGIQAYNGQHKKINFVVATSAVHMAFSMMVAHPVIGNISNGYPGEHE
jgi:hypothetical protein